MQIGDKAHITKSFSRNDIQAYQELGGHGVIDNTVPEPLLAGLFSNLLGTQLPGLGTNYLKQETEYKKPAQIGDTIIASVEITQLRPEKHLVDLKTICTNKMGDVLCTGRALVFTKDVS